MCIVVLLRCVLVRVLAEGKNTYAKDTPAIPVLCVYVYARVLLWVLCVRTCVYSDDKCGGCLLQEHH